MIASFLFQFLLFLTFSLGRIDVKGGNGKIHVLLKYHAGKVGLHNCSLQEYEEYLNANDPQVRIATQRWRFSYLLPVVIVSWLSFNAVFPSLALSLLTARSSPLSPRSRVPTNSSRSGKSGSVTENMTWT
jgi:hypothetical protein